MFSSYLFAYNHLTRVTRFAVLTADTAEQLKDLETNSIDEFADVESCVSFWTTYPANSLTIFEASEHFSKSIDEFEEFWFRCHKENTERCSSGL